MSTEAEQIKPRIQARPKAIQKLDHPIYKLCMGKARIVLRQKGNNSIITGRCKWFRNGFLKLTEATIQPPDRDSVPVPWLLVEQQTIAHIYPEPNGVAE